MCPRYEGKPIQDMARWSGWGAVPEVFDEARDEHFWALGHLRLYLTDQEYIAAQRSTLSAHYTDAAIVQAIWEGVRQFGFTGGQVLEPGCGSGNFIAFAPPGAVMTGVEMEPVTAGIAAALYPDARILAESFADTRIPEGSFDLVIGNVPFGNITLTDRRHNPGRRSIHNHFIKSLALTRPGGIVALLTSRFTMDARNPAARREIAGLADLVAAVRLPSGAHQRAAGTKVVTDLLILRRREPDSHLRGAAWEQACMVTVRDPGDGTGPGWGPRPPVMPPGICWTCPGRSSTPLPRQPGWACPPAGPPPLRNSPGSWHGPWPSPGRT
jgi:hypothetical protein